MYFSIGHTIPLDICSLWNNNKHIRFTFSLAYGFLGDVLKISEQNRWMGPKRYKWGAARRLWTMRYTFCHFHWAIFSFVFFVFFRNEVTNGPATILSFKDFSPQENPPPPKRGLSKRQSGNQSRRIKLKNSGHNRSFVQFSPFFYPLLCGASLA